LVAAHFDLPVTVPDNLPARLYRPLHRFLPHGGTLYAVSHNGNRLALVTLFL
jgi:hypothetical protein